MAWLAWLFNTANPAEIVQVHCRDEDNIPPHVNGQVYWRNDGYYLAVPYDTQPKAVEFINNYWYIIFQHDSHWYTALEDCIEPNTLGTGYWRATDPQHPDYNEVSTSQLRLDIPETELRRDPAISPFVTARQSDSNSSGSESTSPETGENEPTAHPTPIEPSVEQVLITQFQHVLDIEDREPENPLTPDQPAYLHLVEEAVHAGLNIPPPPPIAHPLHPLAPLLPAPQPRALIPVANIQQQQQQQQQQQP